MKKVDVLPSDWTPRKLAVPDVWPFGYTPALRDELDEGPWGQTGRASAQEPAVVNVREHRVVDGAAGAAFLAELRCVLEDPVALKP